MKIVTIVCIYLIPLFAISSYTQPQKEKYLYPIGEKIAKTICKGINKSDYATLDALYADIQQKCHLDEARYYDALAYYVWEKQTLQTHTHLPVRFRYTKKDKCPVCGMFVYKYPQWVAMIEDKQKKYYFDGVKDLMKYFFSHRHVDHLYAQDYYTKKIIDLKNAYFVIGSDLYGPMGDELIPFQKKKDAQTFMLDHRGKKIVYFSDLTQKMVEQLDE
jgi:nitrous oxide reductase accessory protein NosL